MHNLSSKARWSAGGVDGSAVQEGITYSGSLNSEHSAKFNFPNRIWLI